MPLAVTHVLIPLILADIYRDHIAKKKFNLHYVVIAGIAGLLPDIDVGVFWLVSIFRDVGLNEIHRTFTHSLVFPAIFLVLAFLFRNIEWKNLKLKYVFLAITFGVLIHLILDGILSGTIMPFYPFSFISFGVNLVPHDKFGGTFFTGLDAILLVVWLVHEELNHKISDYI
ncbi:MAG: hypothetical protein CMH62_00765 [Nanoarchaeota archaeon]|nr:hypothetical protein [Nanoarchaeota archaeon]|tara:strand:+ start:1474 stop:1986 length:513 start_codon:yes stop_codon:yes gene_type:complete